MSNIRDDNIFESFDHQININLTSSLAASHIASRFLKKGGLLTLTGAESALRPTPLFVTYGISKAGVHHLISSLAAPKGGLPESSTVCGILPVILDTPQNRKDMPKANFDNWTPLSEVAELLFEWASTEKRPSSGQLVKIITENKITKLEFLELPQH